MEFTGKITTDFVQVKIQICHQFPPQAIALIMVIFQLCTSGKGFGLVIENNFCISQKIIDTQSPCVSDCK